MKREKILVVDDSREIAMALVALARSLDYDATAVHGGNEAINSVQRDRPALLLLDLQMPEVSGFDVLRALRADVNYDRMPIVACSATDSSIYRQQAIDAGGQDYLHKNMAFELFDDTVRRQLDAAESRT